MIVTDNDPFMSSYEFIFMSSKLMNFEVGKNQDNYRFKALLHKILITKG